jgi:hypothetical protein
MGLDPPDVGDWDVVRRRTRFIPPGLDATAPDLNTPLTGMPTDDGDPGVPRTLRGESVVGRVALVGTAIGGRLASAGVRAVDGGYRPSCPASQPDRLGAAVA